MPSLTSSLRQRLRPVGERLGCWRTRPGDHRLHIDAAITWLKRAQEATPDAGVSQTFLIRSQRWAPSYPETTGYIIPTFFRYAALTGEQDARERALRMADWECEVQHPSGGVLAGALGDSDQPTVFNTGQVLFGWARAFEESGDERYRQSAVRAADWLCSILDDDGCWRRFGSPMTGKSINVYNTRSAWGLLRTYDITGDARYREAALRNCRWALSLQHANGWLPQNCLQDDSQPFVHTIAYAMRGLMEVGAATQDEPLLAAALRIGHALAAALPADGFLPGRFDAQWKPTVGWSCLTGDAQIAINWGRLYQITGETHWREHAGRAIGFLKSTQLLSGTSPEVGGIRGSHPTDGGYHPWQCPNWAAKFFADALMLDLANHGGPAYLIRKA